MESLLLLDNEVGDQPVPLLGSPGPDAVVLILLPVGQVAEATDRQETAYPQLLARLGDPITNDAHPGNLGGRKAAIGHDSGFVKVAMPISCWTTSLLVKVLASVASACLDYGINLSDVVGL
jgi:hypothetical protein